jgi:hypothetical protein
VRRRDPSDALEELAEQVRRTAMAVRGIGQRLRKVRMGDEIGDRVHRQGRIDDRMNGAGDAATGTRSRVGDLGQAL